MIKKIIFDVDDTLLDSKKDCLNAYIKYFNSEELANKLYNIIGKYDEEVKDFNKDELIKYINDNLGTSFDENNFREVFEIYSHEASIYEGVKDVLDKLSKKFELVTLSRWYASNQRERLKEAGIDIYFKEIYGFENAGIKPSEESYLKALGDTKKSECLVVGDNLNYDYIIPKNLGMNALLLNKDNKDIDADYITDLNDIFKYLERGN